MEKVNFSSFEDVERDVHNEYALLWIWWDGQKATTAMVTQAFTDVCTIVALGGLDRKAWLSSLEKVEQYARQINCTRMRVIGRRGWARVLKDYRQTAIVLERKL